MKGAVLGRGTNEHSTSAFFSWESPDGSGINVFKVRDVSGYGSFSIEVIGQADCGVSVPAGSEEFEKKRGTT